MIFLQLLILVLFFASALLLTNELIPVSTKLVGNWQKKRAEKMLPGLDKLWVYVPFKKLLLMNILLPLVLSGAAIIITKKTLAGVVGFAAGLILPAFIVRFLDQKRKKKFSSQLVDALMMLSGSLKRVPQKLDLYKEVSEDNYNLILCIPLRQ